MFGADSPTGGDLRVRLSLDLLGLDVRSVFGVDQPRIGFQRGEFNVNYDTSFSYEAQVVPLIESGEAVPLFSLGQADAKGVIGRDPVMPDVPTFAEQYRALHGADPQGPGYDAWMTIFRLTESAAKVVLLPPETPQPIVDLYWAAAKDVVAKMHAPENEAATAEIVGTYAQATGEQAAGLLRSALTFDEASVTWLRDYVEQSLQ